MVAENIGVRSAARVRPALRPARRAARRAPRAMTPRPLTLALQGGGAHGAFTWGVLDRLLEEPWIEIEGLSGASAGALNAAALAAGWQAGGRKGARRTLEELWRRVSKLADFGPPLAVAPAFQMMTRMFSPYQLNPLNRNPLREILEQTVDIERLTEDCAIKLFLSATNVRTGKVKVFRNGELSIDAVLASACLPFLFQAVEIDGESYWDGGYMGNPALYPLIYHCETPDIVIVHINPIERDQQPRTAQEILNRINEISFNSSLMREMRAIAFVTDLIDQNQVQPNSLKRMLIHSIEADEFMSSLSVSSKLNADWEFLTHLRDVGRDSADAWLSDNFAKVNAESSVDIRARFL